MPKPPLLDRAGVVQRVIMVKNDDGKTATYESKDARDVVKRLKEETKITVEELSQIGGTLGNWLKSRKDPLTQQETVVHGPYTIQDLASALVAKGKTGGAAQQKGKSLEVRVAEALGGETTGGKGKHGQDEVFWSGDGKTMATADVKTKTHLVIVGGPAKAKNLQYFRKCCTDLKKVCADLGMTAWSVQDDGTPKEVIEIALAVLGDGNVKKNDAKTDWTLNDFKPASGGGATTHQS
jgi:hypothetical protein